MSLEFLVQFDVNIPSGTPAGEVDDRFQADTQASAGLADQGVLVRLWKLPTPTGETKLIGLYRTETDLELDECMHSLPLAPWMHISVTQLESHSDDPEVAPTTRG